MHHFFLAVLLIWLFHRLVGRLFLLALIVLVVVLYFRQRQNRFPR